MVRSHPIGGETLKLGPELVECWRKNCSPISTSRQLLVQHSKMMQDDSSQSPDCWFYLFNTSKICTQTTVLQTNTKYKGTNHSVRNGDSSNNNLGKSLAGFSQHWAFPLQQLPPGCPSRETRWCRSANGTTPTHSTMPCRDQQQCSGKPQKH